MYTSNAPDKLQPSVERRASKTLGPLGSVPPHTVSPQQLDDVTLQKIYVSSWKLLDTNFLLIRAQPSTNSSPRVFIKLLGFWIPAHLRK